MRGIDRFFAVILLVGAVGGAAAFARQSGSDSTAQGVDLAAPPLQHSAAPAAVLIAPTPAPTRVQRAAKAPPVGRVTTPQVTLRRPVEAVQAQKQTQPPAPTQAPAPVQAAATPEPPRALAASQLPPLPLAPVASGSSGKSHGHAWGHVKHDNAAPAVEAPVSPAPTDTAAVQLAPVDPSGDGKGNGHGHGWGQAKGRAKPAGD